jgi:uncharacterized protein YdaU (DUF1376 family)
VYYYSHHIGDFARKTAHLTMLEEAAYRRMLDIYYATERPLPQSQVVIYRLVRARSHAEKLAVDIVLGEFFSESPDGWRNSRADEEILKSKDKSEKARHSAEVRWKHADAMRTHSEGNAPNNQYPITNNQEPKEAKQEVAVLPLWLPSDAWKGWLEMRRKNKAPNTPRALKLALGELERLKSQGYDPTQVIDQSTMKGWKSFFPLKAASLEKEPPSKLCDYCPKPYKGSVNGYRACDDHWMLAMDHIAPIKAERKHMPDVEAKAVAGS